MIVAHRSEIIQQLYDCIVRVTGITPEIEQQDKRAYAGHWFNDRGQIIIASAQTLLAREGGKLRLTRFDPAKFSAVIFDEAHHYVAREFSRISTYFSAAGVPSIGVTATPDRRDNIGLGKIFNHLAFVYQIQDAIEDGWLVPVRAYMAPVDSMDLAWVKSERGDLNTVQLAQEMEKEKNVLAVVQPTLEFAAGLHPGYFHSIPLEQWKTFLDITLPASPHRVIVFCASVRQAQMIAEVINGIYPGIAAAVWGSMPQEARINVRRQLNEGSIRIITNCNLWTEGVDEPILDVVIMARPTQSRALYSQMAGRVMRPLPGLVDVPSYTAEERKKAIERSTKPCCYILDFVGNAGRHKLVYAPKLLYKALQPSQIQSVIRKVKRRTGRVVAITDHGVDTEDVVTIPPVVKVKYSLVDTDVFNINEVHEVKPLLIERDNANAPTPKQLAWLMRHGVNVNKLKLTRREASQLIDELIERMQLGHATYRQQQFLSKYKINAKNMSKQLADKIIQAIVDNGYKPLPPQQLKAIIATEVNELL